MTDISQLLASPGVDHDSILEFFRSQPSSMSQHLKEGFTAWVAEALANNRPVDDEWVDRVLHDLDRHNRLTPETIMGAPHAPYVSLNHKQDYHFERE